MVVVWYDEARHITQEDYERMTKRELSPHKFRQEYECEFIEPEVAPPPRQLSLNPNEADFHPCYVRVGVRIDGEERNDIAYYNMDNKSYKTNKDTSHLATEIEPYWRWLPNRQQRRAEERWEAKHVKL